MLYVIELQNSVTENDDRMPSTWSLVGCASTISIGLC